VDSVSTKNDCVVNGYSNIKDATGKYGCNFGLTAPSVSGRFIPDHFETIVKYDTGSGVFMPCPAGLACPASRDLLTYSWSYADAPTRLAATGFVNADIGKIARQLDNNTFWTLTATTPTWIQFIYSGFVYSGVSSTVPGQPFITQIIAENSGNVTTQNYQGALARAVTLTTWNALGSTTTSCATCLTNGSVASSLFSAGVALTPAVSSASALSYTFATVPTAPTDIFMRAAETSGGDGVTSLLATPANSLEGAVKVVSGRVKVSNAYGSELLPLTLSATAQYYSANGWLNSTTDSITQLTLATSYTVGAGSSAVTLNPASGILAGGLLSIKLGKPSAGAGIATVTPTAPGYLPVIPGTATFGVYKNNNQFIYRRESY
jgi:MSHA biogenesis protein MshQ